MTGGAAFLHYTHGVAPKPLPPGWIWIQDVEKAYGVPHRTLYYWLRKGVLTRYKRLGDQRTYLDRKQLEGELELHPVPPKEENDGR